MARARLKARLSDLNCHGQFSLAARVSSAAKANCRVLGETSQFHPPRNRIALGSMEKRLNDTHRRKNFLRFHSGQIALAESRYIVEANTTRLHRC
jgi:hypothetical protein